MNILRIIVWQESKKLKLKKFVVDFLFKFRKFLRKGEKNGKKN